MWTSRRSSLIFHFHSLSLARSALRRSSLIFSRIVQFCFVSYFFAFYFLLFAVLFHVLPQINSIINVRSTPPIVFWHNKYKWVFFLTNPAEKRWYSLDSPRGLPRDALPSTPEPVRTTFARSVVRCRHNQIFSASWVSKFPYPWCSVHWSSAITGDNFNCHCNVFVIIT